MTSPFPVIINNFNLLSWPQAMADRIARIPDTRVIILDNASTYPPLLEYYERSPHEIIRLRTNRGHLAAWKTGLVGRLDSEFYAVTDPDLDLAGIPDDFLDVLRRGLVQYNAIKCGLSLEIRDLPEGFPLRQDVALWEGQYWAHRAGAGFFHAAVDTTFAVYKKGASGSSVQLRADRPYTARHLPWYVTPESIDDEYRYYLRTTSRVSTWGMRLKPILAKNTASRGTRYLSFTFDNADLATAQAADAILNPYKATFYVPARRLCSKPPGDINASSPPTGDWRRIARDGHDIGAYVPTRVRSSEPQSDPRRHAGRRQVEGIGPGPYSQSFPAARNNADDSGFDSIHTAGEFQWTLLADADLTNLKACAIAPADMDATIARLAELPADAWVILCIRGLDGRIASGWQASSFNTLVTEAKQLGFKIRSVAEMTRILKPFPSEIPGCPHDHNHDDMRHSVIYHIDRSDPGNRRTPVTGDQTSIASVLRRISLSGLRLLEIGTASSYMARTFANECLLVDSVTAIDNEALRAASLGLPNYRTFFLNKYGNLSKWLVDRYDMIVDPNIASFTTCEGCVSRLLRGYLALLRPSGFILTHRAGLAWSPRYLIPDALSYSVDQFKDLAGRSGLSVASVGAGVVVAARPGEIDEILVKLESQPKASHSKRDGWFNHYQDMPDKGVKGYRRLEDRI